MSQYMSDAEIGQIREQYHDRGVDMVLARFFGVTRCDYNEKDGTIACCFDATSQDGSEEKRWVCLRRENTPEQNMEILADARKRQQWYREMRAVTPGIEVPPPKPGE